MTHTILAFSTRYPIAAAGMPSSAASSKHQGESREMLQKIKWIDAGRMNCSCMLCQLHTGRRVAALGPSKAARAAK